MSNLPVRAEGKRPLLRNPDKGPLAGVCAGLAEATGIPVALWRLGFIGSTLLWGIGIPAYVALWLLLEESSKEGPKALPEGTPNELSPEDQEIWEAVRKDMESLDLQND